MRTIARISPDPITEFPQMGGGSTGASVVDPGGARCSPIERARPAERARWARVRCRAGDPQPTRIGQDATGLEGERALRAGCVRESPRIENPYIHGAYLGLERAVRELGIRGRVLTPAAKEGFVPSLSLLARQKYDLVIGFGFFAAAAMDRVATEFPETRFAIIDLAHD